MSDQFAHAGAEHYFKSFSSRGYRSLLVAGITFLGACAVAGQAMSLTLEQAREKCRESVGKPFVQSCIKNQGGRGDREGCRAMASPRVQACTQSAMNAANGRANVPVAIPTEMTAPLQPSNNGTASQSNVTNAFIAPPRSIADIAAILDSEKPDSKKIEILRTAADAKPPTNTSREALARFFYDRGNARAQLGRAQDALADANSALEIGRGTVDANVMGRLQQFAGGQYSAAGNPKQALAVFSRQIRDADVKGARGFLFGGNRQISGILVQMGDIVQAESFQRRSQSLIVEARTSGLPAWRSNYAARGQSWEADVEFQRALIFEARGQFREAEVAYRMAEQRRRASVKGVLSSPNPPPESQILQSADLLVLGQARMKARQGRLAEAEADARRALLARLKDQGKYHPLTPGYIMGLADILVEQGRYAEAERLASVAIEINRGVGVADDSQSMAHILSNLGGILNLQQKRKEAATAYAELDKAIAKWEPQRRQTFELNGSRIYSLYASGQIDAGVAAAQELLKREIGRVGEKHPVTASARGTLAVGYMRAGRDADAIREFKTAIPILMAAERENADDDDTTVVAARSDRLRNTVESYIGLLARSRKDTVGDIGVETFRLADTIRGHSVQHALAAASARATVKDAALAELVRREQDLTKQVNAQLGTLNNVLALPPTERDEQGVRAIYASIDKARGDRDRARTEISRRFPSYADLIDPKPPTVDNIKDTLRQGEALLSFYFGREASFVWAVPKNGPVAFASITASAGEIETKVRELRQALEPQATVVSDIPLYDLALAYELYRVLLEPVEVGWKPAKNLIVITNGALGLLPLSLLPTAAAEVTATDEPLFAAYRRVPWLARTHAVTMVPSAAALRTLRQQPQGSDKREPLIGFGDPWFSAAQAGEAESGDRAPVQVATLNTRGLPFRRRSAPQTLGVDSAELAQLPRLPDTADELKSIALALQTDPSKVLNLGKQANEKIVKTTDLSRFRIIAFATHGLVPGEINGLRQPALALTAPDVADVDGDGLLTMEEILSLKLDADWVILSACNTGTGAGAGAEAASGLGRAFFYAGTRSLLLTNWSVHSASASDLVSDIFRRQAADSKLSRAEALRQAIVALMDGPGYVEGGKTLFAYAHPLFWAPYTIIGDGGI